MFDYSYGYGSSYYFVWAALKWKTQKMLSAIFEIQFRMIYVNNNNKE